ncbi:hypothetical protein PVAP13_3NG178027 [Panicum virgatum]|uniref:Uncharacterized protein n=1 Tax=Panicum virgatum TaxID=38727 RepID=A0A8T0U7J1_PANVG|nr:hypothetical protein PVAP13_3NG178027 [Panicum virgatum]
MEPQLIHDNNYSPDQHQAGHQQHLGSCQRRRQSTTRGWTMALETTDIENSRQPPAMRYGYRATTSILQGREPVYATGMINARMSNDHVKNYNDNLLDIGDPYTNLICLLGFAPPLHAPSGTATPPKNYDIKRPPSSTAGTAQHPLLIRLQINTYIEAVQLYIKLREFINGHNLQHGGHLARSTFPQQHQRLAPISSRGRVDRRRGC